MVEKMQSVTRDFNSYITFNDLIDRTSSFHTILGEVFLPMF